MDALPPFTHVVAVGAHPDDETFALGAVLSAYVEAGAIVDVVCFTRGESSTLGSQPDLGEVRTAELREAAEVLGVDRLELLSYPDGSLSDFPVSTLSAQVERAVASADLVVVLDDNGVTAHPDHLRATQAALAGSGRRPVLGWAVPDDVARALNFEFGTGFVGRHENEIDLVIAVDRVRQLRAIARHRTQADTNAVLERRLELLGDLEHLRWLRRPSTVA